MKRRFSFLLMLGLFTCTSFACGLTVSSSAMAEILTSVPREEFKVIGDLTTQLSNSGIEEAKQLLVKGDFRGTREQLLKVGETNKDLPLPELIISGWLYELNFPVMATQVLQQVGFTHGKRQDVQLQLAQIAMSQGRFYEASVLVEAAIASPPEPEWSEAFKAALLAQMNETRGAVEERRGRMAEANAIYSQLLADNPRSIKGHLGAARSSFALGNVEQCEAHFRQIEEIIPDKAPVTEVALATLYLANKDLVNGESWFEKGLARTGDKNSSVRLDYARFLLRNNRAKDAIDVLTQAKPSDAHKSDFAFHIAQAEQMAGNFDKSLPILLRLYKTTPNNFAVANHLAWAMLQSQDAKVVAQGVRLAQLNYQNNSSSLEAIATNAWASFKRGDIKGSHDIVTRPLPSRNFSRDAAYFFSEVLKANGKADEAAGIRLRVDKASGEFFHALLASPAPTSVPGGNSSATPASTVPAESTTVGDVGETDAPAAKAP